MKKFHFLFCAALFAAVLPLTAETVVFRSGRILCAELSRIKPGDLEVSAEKIPGLPEKHLYAALTILPDDGRGISIYDYKLHAFGQNYPCIAVRDADGDMSNDIIPAAQTRSSRKYTLYFVVDASLLGMKNTEAVDLRCSFAGRKVQDQRILFTNCGNHGFTSPASIPQSGKMIVAK